MQKPRTVLTEAATQRTAADIHFGGAFAGAVPVLLIATLKEAHAAIQPEQEIKNNALAIITNFCEVRVIFQVPVRWSVGATRKSCCLGATKGIPQSVARIFISLSEFP